MPFRTAEGWTKEYKKRQSYWRHDGNMKRPHALLTSKNHSSGFFDSRQVIADDELLAEAASDLVDGFQKAGGDIETIDRIVGPKTGGEKLSKFLAKEIGDRRGRPCAWASPTKVGEGESKRMVFDDPEQTVLPGERVLLCDDVLTTSGSVTAAETAVKQLGGIVLAYILLLVNRSDLKEVNGKLIIALINRSMPIWTPAKCPLCPQGSEAIRPKEGDNWARLNAAY